ncbi:MAG: alpha/beta hydrolase [Elusimicrobiota bacterium]
MTWLLLLLPLLLLTLIGACWWGSGRVFHPPAMTPLYVFPEQFGLAHEKVSFPTEDGLTLKGWLIPAREKTDRTIFFCHGWGDNKGDMLDRFHFLARDFNLFFYDSRAHGESGGEFSTIGYLEAIDFTAALRFLKEQRPAWMRRLGFYGLSMGAAVGIRGLAYAPEFRCAVLEAPFASFNEVVEQFCTINYPLPRFPFAYLTLAIIRHRLGADSEPHSPRYHIRKLSGRPLFFISGAQDRLMPPAIVRSLYEEAGQPKELWEIPEAEHGRCQEAAGEEYNRRVREFFRANL